MKTMRGLACADSVFAGCPLSEDVLVSVFGIFPGTMSGIVFDCDKMELIRLCFEFVGSGDSLSALGFCLCFFVLGVGAVFSQSCQES